MSATVGHLSLIQKKQYFHVENGLFIVLVIISKPQYNFLFVNVLMYPVSHFSMCKIKNAFLMFTLT